MKAINLKYFRPDFKAMGTPCEIQLFAKSPTYAKRIADMAIGDVLRLDARYSRYRSASLLSAINQTAASCGEIAVDAETAGLLNYAATCFEESNGLSISVPASCVEPRALTQDNCRTRAK